MIYFALTQSIFHADFSICDIVYDYIFLRCFNKFNYYAANCKHDWFKIKLLDNIIF